MPLLRESAALACSFLRAWPRHWVPRASLEARVAAARGRGVDTAAAARGRGGGGAAVYKS
eukprot:scaffold8119_cov104-Phaeocystis_antarctica.AAC.1